MKNSLFQRKELKSTNEIPNDSAFVLFLNLNLRVLRVRI